MTPTKGCGEGGMTVISEPFDIAASPAAPRLAQMIRWAVLGLVFVVAAIVLGCLAARRAS
ncbi:MAG TPA: hypothetical protein VHW66_04845 [Stellaceae bacterium]|jgi:hypothetical protein|nr:hypothetical protein [Stellaceae bacterium]